MTNKKDLSKACLQELNKQDVWTIYKPRLNRTRDKQLPDIIISTSFRWNFALQEISTLELLIDRRIASNND